MSERSVTLKVDPDTDALSLFIDGDLFGHIKPVIKYGGVIYSTMDGQDHAASITDLAEILYRAAKSRKLHQLSTQLDPQVLRRLKDPLWSKQEVLDCYGLDFDHPEYLAILLKSWVNCAKQNILEDSGKIHIHRLEAAMRDRIFTPTKFAAIAMGTDAPSLLRLLDVLWDRQLIVEEEWPKKNPYLIPEELTRNEFRRHIGFTGSSSGPHSTAYRDGLHASIEQTFGVKLAKVECVCCDPQKPCYPTGYDDLTGDPICKDHSFCLYDCKPASLPPFLVGYKTVAAYYSGIFPYLQPNQLHDFASWASMQKKGS